MSGIRTTCTIQEEQTSCLKQEDEKIDGLAHVRVTELAHHSRVRDEAANIGYHAAS